jgi:hypothetical protein
MREGVGVGGKERRGIYRERDEYRGTNRSPVFQRGGMRCRGRDTDGDGGERDGLERTRLIEAWLQHRTCIGKRHAFCGCRTGLIGTVCSCAGMRGMGRVAGCVWGGVVVGGGGAAAVGDGAGWVGGCHGGGGGARARARAHTHTHTATAPRARACVGACVRGTQLSQKTVKIQFSDCENRRL